MEKTKKRILRGLGNWGVSFFTPLASGGIGNMVLDTPITFLNLLLISAINATFYTGLVISEEVRNYAKRK